MLLAAVVAAATTSSVALAQSDSGDARPQPVEVDAVSPPWRDLPQAQRDLEAAIQTRDALQADRHRANEDLTAELSRLGHLNDEDSAQHLLKAEAERLVVQQYMSGGSVEDLNFTLEVAEATDTLWRETLLSEMSGLVSQAIEAREDVLGERERTESSVERLQEALPDLDGRLAEAEEAIKAAEWVVYIAEINDRADRTMARTGFIEPTEKQWDDLRMCESTNRYTVESDNGLFYGAYQFTPPTWEDVGGTGNPAHAPPEEQDARARLLYSLRGDQPWPRDYCGRWLPAN